MRSGRPADLDAVGEIQSLAPDAAHWNPQDYLAYDFCVAVWQERVLGFLVARRVAEGETEILNLAVHPDFRRRGAGMALLKDFLLRNPGQAHLEIRDGNSNAFKFYKSMGFQEVAVRVEYYHNPPGNAIVMTLDSCYCHLRR